MRPIVVVMVVWLLGCGSGWAQPAGENDFKAIAGGIAGGGKTWDDEGQIGTGLLLGVRADRRLFGNTFAEVSIDRLGHERTDRFAAKGKTLLFTGAIVQRFGRNVAQPYILGGVTIARHDGSSGFPELGIQSSSTSTNAGVVFGGGVAVRAGTRYEVGPEARFVILTTGNNSAPAYASWIGGRFAVGF